MALFIGSAIARGNILDISESEAAFHPWWDQVQVLGPFTPLPICLSIGQDDLYTIQNENPKLQPNPSTQSATLPLPI